MLHNFYLDTRHSSDPDPSFTYGPGYTRAERREIVIVNFCFPALLRSYCQHMQELTSIYEMSMGGLPLALTR
jgi:hypothetical protein